MRILLDENLDWRLRRYLPGHEVESVSLIGWAGTKNGALLQQAQDRFDILITMDSSLPWQQNLAKYTLAVVSLKAPSNRLADTRALMPRVLSLRTTAQKGEVLVVSAE